MKDVSIKLAAKTDVGLERSNNEDNFQLSADLTTLPMSWVNNRIVNIGAKGTLLVVADGMGGMNAGEVASEIAIETVRQHFKPELLSDDILKNRFCIEKYMKQVIQAADAEIKKRGKNNQEQRGMGTTIVMAWLYDGMLYVSWCGDSRAYLYNPVHGLRQISKDHSYVQGLVDKGVIKPEDAFDFPDSNIITRSLCDSGPKAIPDCLVTPIELCNNDIILLCSDGLSGMIRDAQIEQIISANQEDMGLCVDALIEGALHASGADNVTVALCKVISGGGTAKSGRKITFAPANSDLSPSCSFVNTIKHKKQMLCLLSVLLILGIVASIFFWNNKPQTKQNDNIELLPDTLADRQQTIEEETNTIIEDNQIPSSPNEHNPVSSSIEDGHNPNPLEKSQSKDYSKKDSTQAKKQLNITPITTGETLDNNSSEEVELYEYKTPKEGMTIENVASRMRVNPSDITRYNPSVKLGIPLPQGTTLLIPKNK